MEAIAILFFIGLFFLLLGFLEENRDILILSVVFFVLAIFTNLIKHTNKDKDIKIDLPEEYQEISKSFIKPDTLLGYYKDGTLFIEFKPK